MNHQHNIDLINNLIINTPTTDGYRFYHKSFETTADEGDESSFTITKWTTTQWEMNDENCERETELTNQLLEKFIANFKMNYNPQLIHHTGSDIFLKDDKDDTIHLKITDHTIYLTQFDSGQY